MKVSVGLGRTINTGNYNSFRVDFGVESDDVFTEHNLEEAKDKLYTQVKGWVDEAEALVKEEYGL
jgi:hypothetical protein